MNVKWFTAGRWIQPALSCGYWHGWEAGECYARLGLPEVSGRMMVLDGYFVYDEKELEEIAEFGLKKMRDDIDWFKGFSKESESAFKALEKASVQVRDKDLLEGWISLSRPMHELFTLWTLAYLHFDRSLNEAFRALSRKTGVKEEELAALVKPAKPTRVVLQQKEARKLKGKILEFVPEDGLGDGRKVLAKIGKDAPGLRKQIEWHLEEYGYVGIHHFWGEPLSFEKILDVDLKEKSAPSVARIPAQAEELVELAGEIAFWRQYLAETTGVATFDALPFFKESAIKVGIAAGDYMHLADFEYVRLFEENKKFSLRLIEERKKAVGMLSDGVGARIISGAELAEELHKTVKVGKIGSGELNGVAACPGRVVGRARILLGPGDIPKVGAGDVLVAPETAPDFVPAMRKAAAVVTERGGITSHAAIVSRELGVPCIVGVKNATAVLKDGDLIEVDAAKGRVRKI